MRALLQEEDSDRALRSPETSFSSTPSPFDSSLVLTILVLLTVLFFMAFFSFYIRRFSSRTNSTSSQQTPSRLHKRDGVDASTVQSLPNVLNGGDLNNLNRWSECSICLAEFEERETVKVIPYCQHGFHPMCIDTWLSSHGSCPLCRSTQLFPTVDEVKAGTG